MRSTDARSLAARLIEYRDNPHHINPMSEAFRDLCASAAKELQGFAKYAESEAHHKMPWQNRYGFLHRIREALWVLTGKWSLHRACQAGRDQGAQAEYARLMTNRAVIGEFNARDRSNLWRPPIGHEAGSSLRSTS